MVERDSFSASEPFGAAVFRYVRGVICVLLAIYLLSFALLYFNQRSLLFHPDTQAVTPQQAGLSGFDRIEIASGQASWWHAPSDRSVPVILYFHGNGGALAGRAGIFAEMSSWGAGVLAVGYPGYGGNSGKPNEQAMIEAAQANYDWLISHGVKADRIVITGHSMGTGVAVQLAAKNPAAGLILESPFTSLAEVAQQTVPVFPIRHLVWDSFESANHIEQVKMPVIWMHGTADQLIPYAMGKRLFDMVHGQKCYLRIDGGDHDHLWEMGVNDFTRQQANALVRTRQCLAGHS